MFSVRGISSYAREAQEFLETQPRATSFLSALQISQVHP